MKSREKMKKPVHIGQILQNTMDQYRSRSDTQMARLFSIWPEAVGAFIAENTRPYGFKGSLLIVQVNNSSWMQDLVFLKSDLILKINQALGQEMVKEIKFKIGTF